MPSLFRLMLLSLIKPLPSESGSGEIIMDETGAWMLHLLIIKGIKGIKGINGIGGLR